jgi:hypothetical protein
MFSKLRSCRRSLVVAVSLAAATPAAIVRPFVSPASAQSDSLKYRGFVVDVSSLRFTPNRDSLVDAMRRQFDIITSVGLDSTTLTFFRTIPFLVDTVALGDTAYRGSFAGYCGGLACARLARAGGRIKLVPHLFAPADPVFLHELLHAYHDHRVPDGFDNTDIAALFDLAKKDHLWPDGSYVMRNRQEYFASIGTVYLWGCAGSRRPCPFTRDSLRIRQPALYDWFAHEFGPR